MLEGVFHAEEVLRTMRLAILTSHPIQYYAPLFREVSRRLEVKVFFAHKATPDQQAAAGFGTAFEWDTDLLAGYDHEFLSNVSTRPSAQHFYGCDTPEIEPKLRLYRPSALLVTGWHLKSYWQGVWAAKRNNLPIIVRGDSHLDTPRNLAKRVIKRLTYPALLRIFDMALFVGERNRAYWLHYGYPPNRLIFSPHCVDNELFATGATLHARLAVRSRFNIPVNSPVALLAGKLVPQKRPIDLIRAAAVVRALKIDLHVLIAGSGELEPQIQAEANKLGVPAKLMGFQNQSQMPAAYAAADVLVLPSRESWGLVANEALACGRPIVVSDAVGCAPDLAIDNRVGRTFPIGDIIAMADAIVGVVQHGSSEEVIGMRSRQFSLAAAAEGITEAVDLVQRRRRSMRAPYLERQ